MKEHNEQNSAYTMDAKEYLKLKGLKNPPLDSGISGGGDAPRRYASIVMLDFAKMYSRHRLIVLIEENASFVSRITELEEENKRLRETIKQIEHNSLLTINASVLKVEGFDPIKTLDHLHTLAEQALKTKI